ncbi:MAG: HD domain-containing protein [Rectinemataceae bacterium]|nr:HD domain-containing protein [Rectinemataceae bacterium]
MSDIIGTLHHAGIPCWEFGITAVDAYCGHVMKSPVAFYLVEGSIVDLARNFEKLEYPSLPYADASLSAETSGIEARFLCADSVHKKKLGSLALTDFRRNPLDGRFHDPRELYPILKGRGFDSAGEGGENALFETALYASRLQAAQEIQPGALPGQATPLWQRDLLSLILQGEHSAAAFNYLKDSGFIRKYWTDLDALLLVDHAKDCHPEGGGWSHTMEALGYRKSLDLSISLAILLHDIGKPHSTSSEGRRFDKHAEIGARLATRFLRSLGFPGRIIDDVAFMIRWHMLPAALPRIPISSVSDVVMDSRFIDLLEVFRCDEFSTFKGPDVYYASCAAYKAFMKNSKNPYRNRDGRKKAEVYSRL